MKKFINSLLKKISIFLLTILCFAASAFTQNRDSKGTDFWLTFPGNYDNNSATISLFISADQNTSGTVDIPGIGFSQPFSVTVGDVTTIILPNSALLGTSDFIDNNGIHVTAGQEVTVYGLNRLQASTDAYLGLPTDILGTDYINLGYFNSNVLGTQFGIVATKNNTTVTITPSMTTDGHTAGTPYNINLNQGQTYLLRNNDAYPSDLTGSIIHSDKPIGVFGGHQAADVPEYVTYADHLVEELPPINEWGKNFVTVPLKTRLNGDTFRFLASEDGTDVNINGSLATSLNKGQFYETIIDGSAQITSTKPILVAQYSNGSDYDGVTSDPFMMLIPPYEQFLGNYTINTPATGFTGNYVNVVAPADAVGSIKLDGTIIPASDFSPIGSSGFSGAQEDISLGVHTLDGGGYPFGVFVYGYADYDSYGYPGGQSLSEIVRVNTLDLTPKTGSAAVNTSQCFTALIKDQNNKPVVGVRVDFKVLGANDGTNGLAYTDADGNAQFCYDGSMKGMDTIVATSGSLSDTSYFTRTKNKKDKPPYFDYPPTPTDGATINAHPGEAVTFTVQSEDSDAGNTVILTATGMPTGASVIPALPADGNPVSVTFTWTPGTDDVGTYPVQFTATDDSDKTAMTTVIVQVTSVSCNNPNFRPFVYAYPLFTAPNQAYHTIYKGYGEQSEILTAVPRGGSGNPFQYRFKWDNGAILPVHRVWPDKTTQYDVDITDGKGCTAHASIVIHVVDVRCGPNDKKIQVCLGHHTVCVDSSKVDALLKGGAKLGSCDMMQEAAPVAESRIATSDDALKTTLQSAFAVYPNPAVSTVRFKYNMKLDGNAKINIMDLQGRVLLTQKVTTTGESINISKLSNGVYMAQLVVDNKQAGIARFTLSK